jgi:SAM-dependent methyltransferase
MVRRTCGRSLASGRILTGVAQVVWAVGEPYEAYVGRWSRRVAETFVRWLEVPAGGRWLDVGCGTGALARTVLAHADPEHVVGVDPSQGFLEYARAQVAGSRSTFRVGDARSLPFDDGSFDAVVSGLALNFVPEPARAVTELTRVAVSGGVVAAYVWDYAEGMAMMRRFWDAASALDATAADLDEGPRFPLCRPEPLRQLWADAGLDAVAVRAIEIPTVFADFDDYWTPFLGGQGPAAGYVKSLDNEHVRALRDLLRARLPVGADGSIPLSARAWAVRGVSPMVRS